MALAYLHFRSVAELLGDCVLSISNFPDGKVVRVTHFTREIQGHIKHPMVVVCARRHDDILVATLHLDEYLNWEDQKVEPSRQAMEHLVTAIQQDIFKAGLTGGTGLYNIPVEILNHRASHTELRAALDIQRQKGDADAQE